MTSQRYNYCPQCGGELGTRPANGRTRLVCGSCGEIFYENPIVGVAGILINEQGQILLGRRASGAYAGQWCIPCGYLEYDEELREGLLREFKEETGLEAEAGELFDAHSNFHDPLCHTVGIWFMVRQTGGSLQAGDDLDEVMFFDLDNVPEMAFPTDRVVLEMLRWRIGRQERSATPGT